MDDDALRARVRAVEGPVEPRPAFVRDLHDDLAARLGFPGVETAGGAGTTAPRVVRQPRVPLRRLVLLAAAALLIAALAANAATIGAVVERLLHPPSLLDSIRTSGTMTVALRADAPQVIPPGRGVDGFDVDVAKALGARLGVESEIAIATQAEMLAPSGRSWQVALPGTGVDPAASGRVLRDAALLPLAAVPGRGRLGPRRRALDGATVCVADGSPGAAWARGAPTSPALEVRLPVPAIDVVTRPDQAACVAAVLAGDADALVTVSMLPVDLQTDGRLDLVLPDPVAVEPRSIVVDADAAGSGHLRDALDDAVEAMLADGTLAELARERFGTDAVVAQP